MTLDLVRFSITCQQARSKTGAAPAEHEDGRQSRYSIQAIVIGELPAKLQNTQASHNMSGGQCCNKREKQHPSKRQMETNGAY